MGVGWGGVRVAVVRVLVLVVVSRRRGWMLSRVCCDGACGLAFGR